MSIKNKQSFFFNSKQEESPNKLIFPLLLLIGDTSNNPKMAFFLLNTGKNAL